MLWRGIVLAALGIGFGIAAGFCIEAEARLYSAITAIFAAEAGSDSTAAQSAQFAALNAQLRTASLFATPLVAGSLLCAIALLIVLAWRWQTRRITEHD